MRLFIVFALLFVTLIVAIPLQSNGGEYLEDLSSGTYKKVVKLPMQYRLQREAVVTLRNGATYDKIPLSTLGFEWLAPVSIGIPGQTLYLLIDSGSPETWVITPSCETCTSGNYFDSDESSTFIYNGTDFTMEYGGGNTLNGYFATDILSIGDILVVNQTIGFITDANMVVDMDGLLALGLSASSDYGSTTVFDNMILQGLISEPLYTVRLILDPQSKAGGEITFGAIDYSIIDGEITYSYLTEDEHWQISVTNVYFGDKPLVVDPDVTYPVAFDTGSWQMMMEQAFVEYILSQIPGSAYASTSEIRDGATINTYTVPCNTNTSLGPLVFVMGGTRFLMPFRDLVLDQLDDDPDTCNFGLIGHSDHAISWTFGGIFIKNYFMIYDQSTTPPRVGIAYRNDVVYE